MAETRLDRWRLETPDLIDLVEEKEQALDAACAEHEGLRLANRLMAADLNASRAEADRLRELVLLCREALNRGLRLQFLDKEPTDDLLQRIEAEMKERS